MTEGALAPAAAEAAPTVSFYDELAHRRRRGWIYGLTCLVVASAQAVALSAFVTPALMLIVGALAHLMAALGLDAPAARSLSAAIHAWARQALNDESAAIDALDKVHRWSDAGLVLTPLSRLLPLVLPALAACALVWWALQSAFLRGGAVDLAARLAARPVNDADAEEHQLSNTIDEMAIAAGGPTPRLMMIDSPLLNAAAVGHKGEAGLVLVTRGVVDGLSRPETEALAARLIAAIAAGDLRVAQSVMAVIRTLGFFLTVLDLPIRISAWATLFRAGLAIVTPLPSDRQLDGAARSLEASLEADTLPSLDWSKRIPEPFRSIILFPILLPMIVSALFKLALFLWTALFLAPPMALLWRNRCLWTDAAAVRLSRDPESLADALSKMAASGVPDAAAAQSYLFVGAPGVAGSAGRDRKVIGLALSPPIDDRIGRLAAMGATAWQGRVHGRGGFLALARNPVGLGVLVIAGLIVIPLALVLIVTLTLLTLFAMELALTAGMMIVKALI